MAALPKSLSQWLRLGRAEPSCTLFIRQLARRQVLQHWAGPDRQLAVLMEVLSVPRSLRPRGWCPAVSKPQQCARTMASDNVRSARDLSTLGFQCEWGWG